MAKIKGTGLSRRTVVAGLMAGAAAGWLELGGAANALTTRTRYDLKTPQGRAALVLYRQAVAKMQALPESDPLSWAFQANIHAHPYSQDQARAIFASAPPANRSLALGTNSDGVGGIWWTCSHGHANLDGSPADNYAAHFTAWHRLYLWHFERICEKVLGQPFTLPYWNYLDLTQLKLPPEVLKEKLRINRKWTNNALFFPDRRPDFVNNGLRAINGDPGDTDILAKDTMKTKGFFDLSTSTGSFRQGFVAALDQTPHGSVHVRVGTDDGMGMGAFESAARDPIFWLHHANIDRLWESWRVPGATGTSTKDPKSPKASVWLDRAFTFAGIDGLASVKTARDSLSLPGLGYQYDRLQPIGIIAFAAPNAEVSVLKVTTLTETPSGDGAVVGQGNAPVTMTLAPAVPADKLKTLAQDGGNQFWLVIDVETAKNPNSLFQILVKVKKSVSNPVLVNQPVQTFNLFNAGMHARHGMSYKTAWQVDISDLVRTSRLDLSKPLEVTVRPVAGDSSGLVTVHHMRVEAQ